MRMMGANSVRYHAETILERGDDHAGSALEYYGSRGETPLRWGGSGVSGLGLEGRVTPGQYSAVYGTGGASDPTTGGRLVNTSRPGMEIVIAAHKSMAELGVIDKADDMHKIMDAERDATLAYLDAVATESGGRRGRAAVSAPTTGLVYAHTRHATSRAGDPAPHDHVLLANVVQMLDEKAGYKAPDTTLWRDHLHAATMVGRLAAAKVAIDLGYGIEADPGPSGKLGHWKIAGVPEAVMALHSKRAAEIEAECLEKGYASYRSRSVAARSTRGHKRHEPICDLLLRWRAEVTDAGFPPDLLAAEVELAGMHRPAVRALGPEELRRVVDVVLSPEGMLGRRKVFSEPDVIVALGPHLYGQDPAVLHKVVHRVLADPETIPLIGVPNARERVFTTARTLATEEAIADTLSRQMTRSDGPVAGPQVVSRARVAAEAELGHLLTIGQEDAIWAVCTSGRGAEIVLGVAGSGKTTALAVVRRAFEDAGCSIIGTAISGTAARTFGEEAGIELSRTLASIFWRLEHHRLELTDRHVVILDEAGTADDPNLLRLLGAAEGARAKVVLVGDHRQLGPVGPGGAFESVLCRHRDAVTFLTDNVRQRDPEEARALLALRAGNIDNAVSFYLEHGRVRPADTRGDALQHAVEAWAADVAHGKKAVLMAWRRANVAELNARARVLMQEAGLLSGPELTAPGGRHYRAGDQVIVLAPVPAAGLVTSQCAEVLSVEKQAMALRLRTRDGRVVLLGGQEISAERLDHAFALTVHRMQGATAEVVHLYADGGGRELAYVGMSRAKNASYLYAVGDDVDQAAGDLRREWAVSARPRWAIDLGS
ncbi:MAG: MobF family relaxase, partial [Acidimicrobiales bacterium]